MPIRGNPSVAKIELERKREVRVTGGCYWIIFCCLTLMIGVIQVMDVFICCVER